MPDYRITPLCRQHDKASFLCEHPALELYLKKQAQQDMDRRVSAVFVLTEMEKQEVLGYYTLSSTSIDATSLPTAFSKKLPRYPLIPTTLLGRIAVDQRHTRKKLGELLLLNALKRSFNLSKEIASTAVIVDAKDTQAARFYEHYGFQLIPQNEYRLFLPMFHIEQL